MDKDLTTFRAVGYTRPLAVRKPIRHRYDYRAAVPFFLLHVAALAAFFYPPSAKLLLLCLLSYAIRMFGITGGYHRYFSHRTYKMGRVAQFCMAFLAETSGQKGVLWWAAQHRWHHRYADQEEDVHSPLREGFWWSHVGWILSDEHDSYDPKQIADLHRFPELRFLTRHYWIPPTVYAGIIFLVGGLPAFIWGFVVSTVVLYHCTFFINSLAHLIGTRRFDTPDGSRNNWLLALITFGEGWHNNHHFSMNSCRQGYKWWELDITWEILRFLSLFGITRDLRPFRIPSASTPVK